MHREPYLARDLVKVHTRFTDIASSAKSTHQSAIAHTRAGDPTCRAGGLLGSSDLEPAIGPADADSAEPVVAAHQAPEATSAAALFPKLAEGQWPERASDQRSDHQDKAANRQFAEPNRFATGLLLENAAAATFNAAVATVGLLQDTCARSNVHFAE